MGEREILERFQASTVPFPEMMSKARYTLVRFLREVPEFSLPLLENIDGLSASFVRMYGFDQAGAVAAKEMLNDILQDAALQSFQEAPRKVRREALRDYQRAN